MSVTPLLHQPRLGSYAWKALRYFNGYRLFVPLLIGGLYLSSFAPNFLGTSNRFLFETVLVSYFLLTLSSIFLIQIKPPPFNYLVSILVSIDIASITLLMHASGGLNSGLGMLLAVSSASACLLLAHQMALGFAAFSSL
ncbi:MAG: hypothetical protein COW84_03190, partial [Gammaproteobacteria bacterium CG22_combo_CG10-13_8_21_14_all_40_8]